MPVGLARSPAQAVALARPTPMLNTPPGRERSSRSPAELRVPDHLERPHPVDHAPGGSRSRAGAMPSASGARTGRRRSWPAALRRWPAPPSARALRGLCSPGLERAPTTRPASIQRRFEAPGVIQARAGTLRSPHQDVVEHLRGSTATVPGTSTRPPRGADAGHVLRRLRLRHHLVVARPGGAARRGRRGSGRRRRPCRAGSRAGRPTRPAARARPATAHTRCRPGRRRPRARRKKAARQHRSSRRL